MSFFIGIKFNNGSKIYNFQTEFDDIKIGDFVIVDTLKGLELAEVFYPSASLNIYKSHLDLKPIIRKASLTDIKINEENKKKAIKASKIFNNSINKIGLQMKLINAEYTLDQSKIIFSYLADERVDFRELLKMLAYELKCRIELRQVGPRDKAKIIGGIGVCGLQLCCNLFLNEFDGISINRAKNQMLAINIPKLSGQCGKLMCCLKFEDEQYEELKKQFPPIGSKVTYNNDSYNLSSFNVLSKICKIDSSDKVLFVPLSELNKPTNHKEFDSKRSSSHKNKNSQQRQNKNEQESKNNSKNNNQNSNQNNNNNQNKNNTQNKNNRNRNRRKKPNPNKNINKEQ